MGKGAVWWTSSERSALRAAAASIWNEFVYEVRSTGEGDFKSSGFSVRCLQGEGLVLPAVSTAAVSIITPVAAYSGGNINSDGGSPVTERGICWSTIKDPTPAGNKISAGSGTGNFNCYATNLDPNTTYYIRAYAINSTGTAYGEQYTFSTDEVFNPILFNPGLTYGEVSDIDGNIYKTIKIGAQEWMAENLRTTRLNDLTPIPHDPEWLYPGIYGYCWYNNDETTFKNIFGALYSPHQITGEQGEKLCPVGWHVPSDEEWTVLIDYMGGENVAGGKMKELGSLHWNYPNNGATNENGFTALPGGMRQALPGAPTEGPFEGIGSYGYWWSTGGPVSPKIQFNDGITHTQNPGYYDKPGLSVRCIKTEVLPAVTTTAITSITPNSAIGGGSITSDGGATVSERGICWTVDSETDPTIDLPTKTIAEGEADIFSGVITGLTAGTTYYVRAYATNSHGTAYGNKISFTTYKSDAITDADGNYYNTVTINGQVWMAENLKTTQYNNNTPITPANGAGLYEPSYSWYNNDEKNKNPYGALYNWFAVNTDLLCPVGWHVPADFEWHQLVSLIDANSTVEIESLIAGGKLKETGFDHWLSPNAGATDEYGFTALPGGGRYGGEFSALGSFGHWWTSTDFSMGEGTFAWKYDIHFDQSRVWRSYSNKGAWLSVRCVSGPLTFTAPRLTTTEVTAITQTSAQSGGDVTSDGGSTVLQKGVCWTTNAETDPTVELSAYTTEGGGIGPFLSNITGLEAGTTYYLRAYATNSIGTAYGNEIEFTTPTSSSTIEGIIKFGPLRSIETGTTIRIINPAITGTFSTADGSYQISNVPTGQVVTISVSLDGVIKNERTILVASGINVADFWIDAAEDADENFYSAVEIGSQIWLGENLKTTMYSNGDIISTTSSDISGESTPKYQWAYNGNESNVDDNGRLYTWYSVTDSRNVCPVGWHVPAYEEWVALRTYLRPEVNGANYASWPLKEPGTAHWLNLDANSTNETGFTALPGGQRSANGSFSTLGTYGTWWTASEYNSQYLSGGRILQMRGDGTLYENVYNMKIGLSVRCIKDTSNIVVTTIDDNPVSPVPGSLRAAILEANQTPEMDKITFRIPPEVSCIIQPKNAALPDILHTVVIDGFSQPGSSAETSTILVEINGEDAGTSSNGLTILTDDCIIKGLAINNFTGNGIQITNGNRNLIRSNAIYDNGGNGIQVISGIQNTISANSIYNNDGLGIDLGTDGVTLNNEVEDFNDQDTGPNNLQNFPVLDKIVFSLGEVIISGHLPGKFFGKPFTLDFFASKLPDNNELPDKIRFGEGQTYLGSLPFNTSDPNASFENISFPYKTIYGDVITATATDHLRNTSEFSMAVGGLPDQNLSNTLLNYSINSVFPDNSNGVPRISRSAILKAVNDAFSTWNGITTAKFNFNYQGETIEQHAHIDGENVVSFNDDEYLFGEGVLAITAKTLKLGPTDEETQILDADIIFNPYFANHELWNFGIADDINNVGYFDIQSITTHEIGHILGLLHSGVHNSTMWFEMSQGIDARSLEQDDKSWASYMYPEPGNNFGSISGHITYGYDDALTEPIAGALVLAINTSTNDTIHSYSDADGNYIVPGLPGGYYNVYIEPLDGNVRGRPLSPRNISLYIYCNTTNFDYPGEFYSGENETAVESEDNVTSVAVVDGTMISNINFVTNTDITPPTVVSVTPPDISISPEVIIKFSEALKMNTVNKESCYLLKSGETVHIGGSYTVLDGESNAIIFYPEEVLDYNTRYTLYITTVITDLKDNHLLEIYHSGFKTGIGDKKPPTIVGIVPSNEATGVFVDDKIVITFSEGMDKLSVKNSFTISPDIATDFYWDNENKILTVSHSSSFTEGANYSIGVSTVAKDMSGNAMTNAVSSSFSIVPSAPPTIKYLEPGKTLKSGITVKTPVVADFSESINTASINKTNFKLLMGESNGTPVDGTFEFLNEDSRVVFRPVKDLNFNQKYTIVLTTDISDVSKPTPEKLLPDPNQTNSGIASITSFTTAAQTTVPSIKFIDPPSDHIGSVVTIGGKGFDPVPGRNTVTFNNNVVAPVISASLTSLSVKVPVGAVSGVVHVKVAGVQDDALSPYDFLVIQAYSDPCNEARGSAQTGGESRDVAMDISGALAYVTNSGSNSVSVIDMINLETIKTIPVGEYPLSIDINPEGSKAYVTNHGSRTVSVIDLTTYKVSEINVGLNPYGVAVSPDGKLVFVANYTSQDVSVIDVDPTSGGFDHVTSNIVTGTENRKLAIDANSSMIVVTGNDGLKIIELIKTEFGFDYSTTNASAGTPTRDTKIITEAGLAVVSTMDGRLLFIGVTKGTDTFGAVIANSTGGAKAGQVQPDFSGVFLYVSNPYDDQVTVYKMTYGGSGSEIGSYNGFSIEEYWTIPTGISPQGMAINSLNNELLVVNEFGETGLNGSVTSVKICCREKSVSDEIVALAFYIEGMMGRNDIQESLGHMLINKLNDAIINLSKGKTKTAINSMKAFIDKVTELRSGGKVTFEDAKVLIDAANAIIAKMQISKSVTAESSDLIVESNDLPVMITETKLGAIYPNPSRDAFTIDYEIADDEIKAGKVTIQVYDVLGKVVGNLVSSVQEPGSYSVSWNGRHANGNPVSRGIYYVRFNAGNVNEVKRIMLVR